MTEINMINFSTFVEKKWSLLNDILAVNPAFKKFLDYPVELIEDSHGVFIYLWLAP